MKKLAIAIAATAAFTSSLAANEKTTTHGYSYLQGGINVAELSALPKFDSGNTWNAGGSVGYGYNWKHNHMTYGVLSQFNYFGKTSDSLSLSDINATADSYAYTIDVDALIGYQNETFRAYAGPGLSYVFQKNDAQVTQSGKTAGVDYTSKKLAPNLIIGAGYEFTAKWSAYAQYEHVFANNSISKVDYISKLNAKQDIVSSINSFTFGIDYQFS